MLNKLYFKKGEILTLDKINNILKDIILYLNKLRPDVISLTTAQFVLTPDQKATEATVYNYCGKNLNDAGMAYGYVRAPFNKILVKINKLKEHFHF